MAVFIAEQYQEISEFKGFLEKKNLYMESGFLFRLLSDKFGKEQVVNFLKAQSGVSDRVKLNACFNEIFGLELEYSSLNSLLK